LQDGDAYVFVQLAGRYRFFAIWSQPMRWTVDTLNPVVDAEVEMLPHDMRARLVRLAEIIEQVGLDGLPFSSVRARQTIGESGVA
jgi:hypothetical protein